MADLLIAGLQDYLRREAGRPAVPAACGVFMAGWVSEARGVDPLPDGTAMTEAEVAAVSARPGGLALAVARALRAVGLKMTRDPRPGDIAVVTVAGLLCCAIRHGSFWALRLEGGPALVKADRVRLVAAWRV